MNFLTMVYCRDFRFDICDCWMRGISVVRWLDNWGDIIWRLVSCLLYIWKLCGWLISLSSSCFLTSLYGNLLPRVLGSGIYIDTNRLSWLAEYSDDKCMVPFWSCLFHRHDMKIYPDVSTFVMVTIMTMVCEPVCSFLCVIESTGHEGSVKGSVHASVIVVWSTWRWFWDGGELSVLPSIFLDLLVDDDGNSGNYIRDGEDDELSAIEPQLMMYTFNMCFSLNNYPKMLLPSSEYEMVME